MEPVFVCAPNLEIPMVYSTAYATFHTIRMCSMHCSSHRNASISQWLSEIYIWQRVNAKSYWTKREHRYRCCPCAVHNFVRCLAVRCRKRCHAYLYRQRWKVTYFVNDINANWVWDCVWLNCSLSFVCFSRCCRLLSYMEISIAATSTLTYEKGNVCFNLVVVFRLKDSIFFLSRQNIVIKQNRTIVVI